MRKDQIDLANRVIFIADSKTPTGVAEVPLTDIAVEAFRNQMELAGAGPWLFPSPMNPRGVSDEFQEAMGDGSPEGGNSVFPIV